MSQDHRDTARKVVAAYFLSLDGVAEAPDRFITSWDDETDARGERLVATQDTVVLGRQTYDEWAGFWPGTGIQPFAVCINAVPKYVATSTPLGIHGSISVTRALLDGLSAIRLETIRCTSSPSGHLLVDYRVAANQPGQRGCVSAPVPRCSSGCGRTRRPPR